MTKTQSEMTLRALSYMGDYCAKKQTTKPLYVAWDKLVETGLKPRANSINTYLYRITSEEEIPGTQLGQEHRDIASEVAYLNEMLYQPTENTISIRIKSFIKRGDANSAEKLLWNSSGSGVSQKDTLLRHRTCVPVLELHCQNDDMTSALRLYRRMKDIPSIHFEIETYSMLLSSIARLGYFRCDSSQIQGAIEIGYGPGYGPSLFDQLATEMSEDILEITNECATSIRNGFALGFQNLGMAKNLREVPYDCQLAPIHNLASEKELVACRVHISDDSSLCPRTNARLRLIMLHESQRRHMHDTLLKMADTQYEAYDAKLEARGQKSSKKSMEENYAGSHLDGFAKWLDSRKGKPFTAIVDGANVAYFGLGYVNHHQVKLMVDMLEKLGETPLVVMPQKYMQKKFYVRQRFVQELTQPQLDIIDELTESGKLYQVPHRCLDDYYWMLSSVSNQTVSRNGADLDVTPSIDEKRWACARPVLISNDQMRDHKLELLEPRLFRRWVSSHIINYSFTPFLKDIAEEREISFSKANVFSREIQKNPTYLNESEDELSGFAWHFPVKDWEPNDRFCVRIPQKIVLDSEAKLDDISSSYLN
mmetsp:Transcript_14598/g.16978  ORF Transcript_14598/g.16978 Transcript_14598/m.16978 type:complete len:593 (+) Transcript_14598:1-1779(+)